VTFDVARNISLRSIPLVRTMFWLRARAMGATGEGRVGERAFVDEALAMGWGMLADDPGRLFVAGAECQPWIADVVFRPVPPADFESFAEPDRVKIAWTLEVEPLAAARSGAPASQFSTETRAVATDAEARRKFLRYWSVARYGIIAIRWLLVPAVRREAERRWASRPPTSASPR
jgi:hypothetical protein